MLATLVSPLRAAPRPDTQKGRVRTREVSILPIARPSYPTLVDYSYHVGRSLSGITTHSTTSQWKLRNH